MKIAEEEYKELMRLYKEAQETPVVALSTEELLTRGSWSDQAWNRVREYMDELGRKYSYDAAKFAIGKDGELIERT
jgi:hypothetical protein